MSRVQAHADIFRAIADPTRRAILDRLRAGPAPVNALAEDFAQTRPAISKHLRVLREAALVTERREGAGVTAGLAGRPRLYQLEPQRLQPVASWIEGYRGFWLSSLNNLKRYLEDE
jgi:DNA-binding transcriptional ArsR family regulator